MSQNNHRVTTVCPSAHTGAANQLALTLGESPADVNTFGTPGWQDAQGNLYSVCSFVCTDLWLQAVTLPLQERHDADLEAATRAQDLLVIYTPEGEEHTPASPDTLLAYCHGNALEALEMMGLIRIEEELNV